MYELYIPYDKFPCQYILTTFFVIFSSAFLYIGYHHIAFALWYIVERTPWAFPLAFYSSRPRRGFFRSLTTPHVQFSLCYLHISFRFVFSCFLSHEKTHDMCFFTCLFAFTHSFLSTSCPLASEMCFLASSPMKKHTTCVFSLAYLLLHTVFSPLPAY